MRDFKGVWIPKEIYLDENLSWSEKILLIEIDSLDNEEGCFANNEYFAKFLGISKTRVSVIISKLKKLGYIEQKKFNGRQRILHSLLGYGFKADFNKSLKQTLTKVKGRLKQKLNHNNINNNINNNNNNIITINNTKKGNNKKVIDNTTKNNKKKDSNNIIARQINELIGIFYKKNPGIKFQNKTIRKDTEWFISYYGYETAQMIFEYAISIMGKKFAPSITTPTQCRNKLANLNQYRRNQGLSEFRRLTNYSKILIEDTRANKFILLEKKNNEWLYKNEPIDDFLKEKIKRGEFEPYNDDIASP